jgi:lysozyme
VPRGRRAADADVATPVYATRRSWVWAGLGCGLIVLGTAFVSSQRERWDSWRAWVFGPSSTRYPVRGVDVSHHQGHIDWQLVKASGHAFAFIKASEGADFRDTRFQENWRGARAAGLVTGAYHFFTFCAPGLLQAENFLAVAPRDGLALPPAVDVEYTGNCAGWESLDDVRRELFVFIRHAEAQLGHPLLLYTTEDVWRELVPPELHQHRYWLRSLWGQPSTDLDWRFWQYSDTGSVPGVRGAVDLDVFAGEAAAWETFVARPQAELE